AAIARRAVRPVPRPTTMPGWMSATAARASASLALSVAASLAASVGRLVGLVESAKSHPLCEAERGPVVDRAGLAAHVGLPAIAAGLASAAGVLLAAERPTDLGATGADVDVGDAAVAARGREEPLAG